jgi:tRNA modification GTPase
MYKPKIDTIAAVSTAQGRAAISIIRLSGPNTFAILGKIFVRGGKKTFPLPYSAFFGKIVDPIAQQVIDEVIVTTYLSPNSYTGEDIAEIGAHGNPVVVSRIMQLLITNGARAAEAGEFTKRAFLNGKMDLLEVEAISQLLAANTTTQATMALNQLDGLPSKFVAEIREKILKHLVQLEASLNFPEDAIESIDEYQVGRELRKILNELYIFLDNAKNGSLVSEGLKVALLGKPNSGKSSLMNCILGRDRAIVTDIPGTTRDTLEESILIASIPVKIIDTAGMRKPGDKVEAIGIERTLKAVEDAYAVIGVFDGSVIDTEEDKLIIDNLKNLNKNVLLICNKTDLPQKISRKLFEGFKTVNLSCKEGTGLVEVFAALTDIFKSDGMANFDEMVLLGAQQAAALDKAVSALERAVEGIGKNYQDMLAIDMEETVRELGRVNGETVDMNTLDLIFERFCIGK